MTVILTVGAPASGKSTWAKTVARSMNAVIVCRDDIRAAHNITNFGNPETEAWLTRVQRSQMEAAFLEGMNVIVADTNINKKFRNQLIKFCHEHGQDVELAVFDVSLDTLIARDAKRDKPVGADVIIKMFNSMKGQDLSQSRHPAPNFGRYKHGTGEGWKPEAIVVDIDGTVANHNGVRSVYDESKVLQDKPIDDVIDVVTALSFEYPIVFVSGRTDGCREDTFAWIKKHFDFEPEYIRLYMRKKGDQRPDYVVKAEIYDNEVIPFWNIKMVFDDRDQVVRHVRARGITVAQVSPGRF